MTSSEISVLLDGDIVPVVLHVYGEDDETVSMAIIFSMDKRPRLLQVTWWMNTLLPLFFAENLVLDRKTYGCQGVGELTDTQKHNILTKASKDLMRCVNNLHQDLEGGLMDFAESYSQRHRFSSNHESYWAYLVFIACSALIS